MKLRDFHLIESYNNASRPEGAIIEITELNNFLVELSKTLFEAKINDSGYLEATLAKFIFAVQSIIHLSNGTPYLSTKIIDYASICVLTRSSIENYLILYYLYLDNVSEDEKEFRFLLYKLSGLSNRQRYSANRKESQIKMKKEAKQIKWLTEKLRQSKLYLQYKSKVEKPIGNAKIYTWTDLIKISSLDTDCFLTLWRFFSNYAHSEYISVIQTQDNYKNKLSLEATLNSSFAVLQLLGLLIDQYSSLYPSVKIKYNIAPEKLRTKVSLWSNLARGNKTPNYSNGFRNFG
ncbi:MAG: hypothetical protein AAFZ15_17385 [Bacteroidota bacterium]